MRNMMKMALAGLAFAVVGSAAAHAGPTVQISNTSPNAVWFTIYSVYKKSYDWGCAPAGQTTTTTYSGLSALDSLGGIYVRLEYKQNSDCGGKTLHDTKYGGLYRAPAGNEKLTVTAHPW